MDKRTLLFIIVISLSFLGVNLFFSQKRISYERAALEEQSASKLPLEESPPPPLTSSAPKESTPSSEQRYYVLENPYLQLVFTNVGGALAEVNLPFRSSRDSKSVVNEIGFDREIVAESSANARFPLHPAYLPGLSEPHEGSVGGYYPLLRRGLVSSKKNLPLLPQYYALNIVSDYPEMAELVYEVKEFTKESIVFEAVHPVRRITKTFHLSQGEGAVPYVLDLSIKIEGDSRGLWLNSGVPEVELLSNSSSPLVQYATLRKGKTEVEKVSLPEAKEVLTVSSTAPEWISNSNGYLGFILDPLQTDRAGYRTVGVPGALVPTRLSLLNPAHTPYPASRFPGYEVLLPLSSGGGASSFRIYAGPFEENTLKAVDCYYIDETGHSPNYLASRAFYGWFSFISEPFAKLLFVVMKFFYAISHSWAFSIILLTVFLRLLLYPLNAWSIKSMRRMQLIAPEVSAIQQKYKKEPKKAQMEIMQLYRAKKVNPFMGCLPVLIQIPFLIGMFDLLKSSFQLRGASFIPGWIDNLTAPDVLFQWEKPIFFIGTQFHLLPILLGVVMFVQQRLSSTAPKDPSKMTDQQRQQRGMGTIMTLFFMVMFYNFPSGLNLYWLSSMLLGILQQWVTNRYLDVQDRRRKSDKVVVLPARAKK